jgi:PAS domain S-box-containing protein
MDPRIEALLRQFLQEQKDNDENPPLPQETYLPRQKAHPYTPLASHSLENLVLVISETGIILSVNHPIERMTGRNDLIGSTVWELFTLPQMVDRLRAKLHSFLKQGVRQQFELTLESCEGKQHSVLWSLDRWICDPPLVVMAGLELPQS